jgi:O-antigen/teichoic acid export membrane protein
MSFRREVGSGLFWVAVATLASKGLSLLRQLVLARLLVPADFGLVGYAAIIIGILQLFKEMGFSSALIYRKDDVEEAANVTFVVVILSSLALFGISWVGAPWAASFFRNNALIDVLRALAFTLVISSISQVPLTLMAKGMGFKKKVIPEIIAGVAGSGVSVVLAVMGYGVWSIVYGQIITAVLTSLLVWFFCPWRPSLAYKPGVARELWNYGKHIIGSQIMVFLITNIDDAFIGRFKGDASLGTYTLAYDLSNLPATHLSRTVGQVMFPAFSRIQGDAEKLKNVFFKSMKYVSLAAIPIAIITMVFAEDFIVVAYGSKWFRAVTPLRWLTVYGLARAIAVNMGNVFKVGGRPKWLLYIASWRLGMMVALLYPAIHFYGVTGVAALSAVVSVVDFALSMFLTNRVINSSWRHHALILAPMFLAATGASWVARQLYLWIDGLIHPFISLPLAGGVALAVYGVAMYLYDADLRGLVSEALSQLASEYRKVRLAARQARI